ncbi:MAG: InlB B-repeat-containing protein [Bacilli bacterium]|nr:InlB B-repeat-containing protein [Bacilli bacterium]
MEIDNYYEFTIKPGTELPIPTKRGFEFVGWYDNPAFSGSSITTVSKDTAAAIFYTKWGSAERLVVSFDTGTEPVLVYPVFRFERETVKKPTVPVRDGFTFLGWYSDEDKTVKFDFDTKITEDITIYAKWEEATASDE